MPQTVEVADTYRCSPRELFDVLTDEGYLAARSARFAGTPEPPSVHRNGDEITLVIPRRLPVEHVPAPFRTLVGDGHLVQRDVWTRPEEPIQGRWTAETSSPGLDLGGRMSISASDGGSHYSVSARVAIPLPLIGGPAEKLVAKQLQELFVNEQRFVGAWLADTGVGSG